MAQTSPVALDIKWSRVGAACAFLLLALLVAGVALSISISTVETPRDDAAEYLADLSGRTDAAAIAVFILALTTVPAAGVFFGLERGLSRWGAEWVSTALLVFLVSAALNLVQASVQGVIVGFIAPAYGDTTVDQDSLLITFRALQWFSDAVGSASSLALGISLLLVSVVMTRLRDTWWTVTGWLGIIAGTGNIVSALLIVDEAFGLGGLAGLVTGVLWMIGVGVGLLRLGEDPAAAANAVP